MLGIRCLTSIGVALGCSLVAAGLAHADGQPELLRAAGDGHPIKITYYPATDDVPGGKQNAAVVVLLHGDKGNRLQWDKGTALPENLQKTGYAVITVDLRKHGESVVEGSVDKVMPNDYERMVLGDLVAVKEFIFAEHQKKNLNMNKMAIVAADMSAPVALAFAEVDWKRAPYDDSPVPANRTPRGQDVRAVVLISPDASSGTVHSTRSLAYLKSPRIGLALQVIVGADDTAGARDAKKVYQVFAAIKQNESRIEYKEFPGVKDRGMALIMKHRNAVLQPIHEFLNKYVRDLNSTWQDRRSRLDR